MATDSVYQTCSACGAVIDVTDAEPFAVVHCPECASALRARRQFDHFELQEVLGAGGMGAVYRAKDSSLNREVALKLLRKEYSANEEFVRQFQHEAAVTASITHPNVVKVYSSGVDHGQLYLTMELVDKGSLDDLMSLQGRVAESQVLEVGVQIAGGLLAAFQKGLIHRDIKPGNILFAGANVSKIVDFGLAVFAHQAGTLAGEVWGTPYYVAPEKLENAPEDVRSDIYSLGATLFHALAGRPPFEADTVSMVALKRIKSQPVSLQTFAPDISTATCFVIEKMMHRDPAQRYQTYQDVIQNLRYALDEMKKQAARSKVRVVVDDSKAMSWVTFGVVAMTVLGGVAAWQYRDKWMSKSARGIKSESELREEKFESPLAKYDRQYQAGKKLILEHKYAEAAERLKVLASEPAPPQPNGAWTIFHAGLALLFDGREASSRPVFAEMERVGVFSQDPSEKKLAEFLMDLGKKLAAEDGQPASVAINIDKHSYEGIALLALGLKNWELARYEDAVALLRQYRSISAQAPYEWAGDYKDHIKDYIADLLALDEARPVMEKQDTPDARKAAREAAQDALDKLKKKSLLNKKLETFIAETDIKIAADADAMHKEQAAKEAADNQILTPAKTNAFALAGQLRFSEARDIVSKIRMASTKGEAERDALNRKLRWLHYFKTQLTQDLGGKGYKFAVIRRNGQQLPGGVSTASDAGVGIKNAFGVTTVPWSELHLEGIIAMARSFITEDLKPNELAERKWQLGVFCFFAGKDDLGRTLLVEAAQLKSDYEEDLKIFIETAAPAN